MRLAPGQERRFETQKKPAKSVQEKNARAFFTFCCTSYTLCTYIQSSNKLT